MAFRIVSVSKVTCAVEFICLYVPNVVIAANPKAGTSYERRVFTNVYGQLSPAPLNIQQGEPVELNKSQQRVGSCSLALLFNPVALSQWLSLYDRYESRLFFPRSNCLETPLFIAFVLATGHTPYRNKLTYESSDPHYE